MLLLFLKYNFEQVRLLLQPPAKWTHKQKLRRAIILTSLFLVLINKIKCKSTLMYQQINKWINKHCKYRTFGELFGCHPSSGSKVEYTVWDDHAFYEENYYTWNLCSV